MPTTRKILILLTYLIVATLTATFLLSFFLFVTSKATSTIHFSSSDITAFFYVWIVAALVAIPAALLVGLPSYLVLQRIQFLNLFSICAIGAVIGLLVHLTGVDQLPWWACEATGITSASLAWLLFRRSNYSVRDFPSIPAA